MTKTGFGEHLKREREMRGVSLDEICAATRISARFLEALETEEWERLPGGVFNRGFVRAVSRYLGLDEEGMVAEYVMAVNQGGATPAWSAQQETPNHNQNTTNWLPWIAAAIVLLLLGAGWFGWRFYTARRARSSAAQPAPAIPAATAPAGPAGGAAIIPAVPPPPEIPATTAAGGDATGSPAADKLALKIEAGKATSVTVTADGNIIFAGNFIAGQSRTFDAANQIDVTAQDAGALLLQLNGKTLAPIGPPGHPGKVTLTRRTLQSAAGGPN